MSEVIQPHNPDPVHEEGGKWYFWDETWSAREGPYDTEANARSELTAYCYFLDHGCRP